MMARPKESSNVGCSSPKASNNGFSSFKKSKGDLVDLEGDGAMEHLLSNQATSGRNLYSFSSVIFPFLFPALGALLYGYDIGATSGAVLSITSEELSGTDWHSLSSVEEGLVVSGSLYGGLMGSILAFKITDALGRRRELILAATIYTLGLVLTAVAPSLFVIIPGRLLYGVGIGLAMHAAPMYISETAPYQIRGTMIALQESFSVVGILLGYLVGSLFIEIMAGWRLMYLSALPIAVIMGLGVWWLPPSPRWILLRAVQGKGILEEAKDKARSAYCRLHGKHGSESIIEAEVDETLKSLQTSAGGQEEITFMEVFQGKLNQRAFLIGGGLVFLQQVTGQPSVLYYAARVIQSAGFSAVAAATKISVILGTFKLLMTGVAILYVDHLGRRPLLLGGISGIVLSLLALASYYSFASGFPLLAVSALLVFVGSYQVSFGPISYVMMSEVFPLRSRGRAMSLTALLNFASNAVVAFSFSPLQVLVGRSTSFLIFAVIGVGALGFVYAFIPETKGLTLEEIEAKLSK